MPATVLTNENMPEFVAKKLNLDTVESKPVEVASGQEPVIENKEESEPNAEANTSEEGKPHKGNPKIEQRMSELTKARKDAEAQAEQERQRSLALQQRLDEIEGRNKPLESEEKKPEPGQFEDAFKYAEALAEWSTKQALKNRDAEEQKRRMELDAQERQRRWQERQNKVITDTPDYEEVINSSEVMVSDPVKMAILESDIGPELLYHLAKNPDEAKRLSSLSPIAAIREIGKLETKLEKKPETEGKQETKPEIKPSSAPAPITPVNGKTSIADVPLSSDGEFRGDYATYKQMRKEGKIK
ncbi:MAG: hypothetical protein KGI54_14145 [Pseudomonadota bacterium]|nr:hypothetical protein [Pseudomonadota bacterium]